VGHWPGRQVPDDESGGNYGKDARQSPRKINVVLNWLEELKQKASAD
jgi:hypothetical protein